LIHLAITRLAQGTALIGGLVLIALIALICTSILGREAASTLHGAGMRDLARAWGIGAIRGDYELVEAGMAFAIFCFLPLTQLQGAHARVDLFTDQMGPRASAILGAFWSVVMAAATLLITWRLAAGMQDRLRYNETSFLLQFPIWWAYAACLAAATIAVITSLYCAAMRLTGQRGG
jgi:hypothetical protein